MIAGSAGAPTRVAIHTNSPTQAAYGTRLSHQFVSISRSTSGAEKPWAPSSTWMGHWIVAVESQITS